MLPVVEVHQLTVYFDGLCPFCRRTVEHFRKRDKRGVITFKPIQNVPLKELPAEYEEMMREMHALLNQTGKVFIGCEAFEQICSHIRLYVPLSLMLRFSRKVHLGNIIYRFIAQKRHFVSSAKCTDDSCSL